MSNYPLYWTKPNEVQCFTHIRDIKRIKNQDTMALALLLDESPFYPGGGGQPADKGSIADRPILGYRRIDDQVYHIVAELPDKEFSIGDEFYCCVDEAFRRDSRQQHTGQHLISAALQKFGFSTASVHLGSEYCGIEVDAEKLQSQVIDDVLKLCEEWICADLPVKSLYLSPEEAKSHSLRRSLKKNSESTSPIRVVEIEGIDAVGCGGMHLERSSGIRAILFDDFERIRGRIRLKWIIGNRVIEYSQGAYRREKALQGLLSADHENIIGRVKALIESKKALTADLKKAEYRLGWNWIQSCTQSGKALVSEVQLGKEGLTGAADALANSAYSSAFLVGEAEGRQQRPWLIYCNSGEIGNDIALADSIRGVKGLKGGGRHPMWRGIIEGSVKGVIENVTKILMKNDQQI